VIVTGPEAPDLDHSDDSWAWQPTAALPRHGMRRRRRIDVYQSEKPSRVGIDANVPRHLRAQRRVETIIHEYTLAASRQRFRRDRRIRCTQGCCRGRSVPALPRAAQRIAGMTLSDCTSGSVKSCSAPARAPISMICLRSVADAEN